MRQNDTPGGIETLPTPTCRSLSRVSDPFAPTTDAVYTLTTRGAGPSGQLPLTAEMLRERPSGDIFGLTQNAGMGWAPARVADTSFLILSTQGGLREPTGAPVALGYHTGHWEIGLLVEAAAREFTRLGTVPFAAYCSDPCDGRSQGTAGMFDSLPYRNDAAIVFRRLIRSLPRRAGVLGIATCDKGLPAMMMALAGTPDLPTVLVPGGVTLPAEGAEDAGTVQTIGARFSHGLITLETAAEMGCRACGSPGGGCQFLGTAATSQVVAEALGMTLPHSALAPSGQPIWLDMATRSARARSRGPHDAGHPDTREYPERDGRARGLWRLHESLAARARHRARGWTRSTGRLRVDRDQPPRAAARRRPPQRSCSPPHGSGVPRGRCARGDVAPARPRRP
jgi:hypothetical protein